MSLQDFDIQTLAPGDKWPVSPGGTVTYSFVTAASASSYPADADETNIGEVTEGIKNNIRQILNNLFSSVIPIKFQEVPDTTSSHGQIRILFSDGPGKGDSSSAYAYFPGNKPNSGAVHTPALSISGEIMKTIRKMLTPSLRAVMATTL